MKFFLIILFCVAALAASAQRVTNPVERLRMAESYEQAGEDDNAARIYNELYSANEKNYRALEGLTRTLTRLKRYSALVDIYEKRFARAPDDPLTASELGKIYYEASRRGEARAVWEKARTLSDDIQLAIVAQTMAEVGAYDEAVETFLVLRKRSGDEGQYARELAQLYLYLHNYCDVVHELSATLRRQPGELGFTQSRLSIVLTAGTTPEEVQNIISCIEDEADKLPPEIGRTILVWLYGEIKNYEKAFEVVADIDRDRRKSGKGYFGSDLFSFGDRSLRDGAYKVAQKAFQLFRERYPSSPLLPQVMLDEADALAKEGASAEQLIKTYRDITERFPGATSAAQAFLAMGDIALNGVGDITRAFEYYRKAEVIPMAMFTARIKEVNVMIIQGKLDEAFLLAARSLHESANGVEDMAVLTSDERDQLELYSAEIELYKNHVADATARLKTITARPVSNFANDAADMLILLSEGMGKPEDSLSLSIYMQALLAKRERRYPEAAEMFREFLRTHEHSPLVDDAVLGACDSYASMGDTVKAVQTLEDFVTTSVSRITTDKILFRMATLVQYRDVPKAIATYSRLLAEFPNSLYAQESRKRIRMLRGETL